MPVYDFQCTSCNHKFEKILSISNRRTPESEPCPNCQAVTVLKNDGNANEHIYGLGAEAKNNYGGFGEVLNKIKEKTKHTGGKVDTSRNF